MTAAKLTHNHPPNPFGALDEPGECPRCDQRRAELNAAGRTQHNHGGPFGFRRVAGCPRCAELTAGAPAREPGPAAENWQRNRDADAQLAREIREHDCTTARCAAVCTFGQW